MWLAAALALLALVAVGVLWTPIDIDVAADRKDKLQLRLRIGWLFGLVAKELDLKEQGQKARPAGEKKRRRPRSSLRGLRIARSPGFLQGLARLIRRTLSGIELRQAALWARAGFDDPADTGRLLAWLFPMSRMVAVESPVRFDFEPDFAGAVLMFRARGGARIVPSKVLGPLLAFALSPATLRAIWAARA